MNKLFIFFFLVVHATYAHQPDMSSTMLVEKADGQWVLQVRSALTALEYEIKYNESNNEYETPGEFQQLVVNHLKNNVKISINQQDVCLVEGIVNLGHETSVVFKLLGTYNSIQEMDITNTSFSKINKNKSALVIMKDGMKPQQFSLSNQNEHRAHLYIKNDKFENRKLSDNVPGNQNHHHYWRKAIIGTCAILFFGFLWFFVSRRNAISV